LRTVTEKYRDASPRDVAESERGFVWPSKIDRYPGNTNQVLDPIIPPVSAVESLILVHVLSVRNDSLAGVFDDWECGAMSWCPQAGVLIES
jgi:hypothetical protein